jgi:hypothetical protein
VRRRLSAVGVLLHAQQAMSAGGRPGAFTSEMEIVPCQRHFYLDSGFMQLGNGPLLARTLGHGV